MSEQLEVLRTVAARLDGAGIAYMLSGSTAMIYYAVPRMTRDIDLVVELREADVPRLVEAFEDAFYIDGEAVADAVRVTGMFNAIHDETITKVDFVVRKDTAYRRAEFERRRAVRLASASVWIVSAEDLILSKLLWMADRESEVQSTDVKRLLAVESLDREYLRRWAERLELLDALRRIES